MSVHSLNIDAFPDITPVRVEVDTSAPGLAAEEVEKLVTHPLEVALARAFRKSNKNSICIQIRDLGGHRLL